MEGEATLNAVELFVILVAVAALVALVARRIAVPYTVALVVFGLGGAIVAPRVGFGITEELVLAVLLPGLIFEAAYQTDLGSFRRAFGGIALLAAPGVLITAAIVALVLQWTVQLPFGLGFVVGAMVAATDPAAVVSTFKRLRSPKRLAALVEGESLLNDGTALVVFAIALRAVTFEVSAGEAILTFALTIIFSTAIGALLGLGASRIRTPSPHRRRRTGRSRVARAAGLTTARGAQPDGALIPHKALFAPATRTQTRSPTRLR